MLALMIASAAPMPQIADLAWMAGHWLECSSQGESAETWTDGRGQVMLGLSKSLRNGRTSWELSRIDRTADGITFFASPKGQHPTAFKAVSIAPGKVVFENSGHDFPQRVIYLREGERLTGRIEGVVAGARKSVEWHYRRAALNAVCPRNPPLMDTHAMRVRVRTVSLSAGSSEARRALPRVATSAGTSNETEMLHRRKY